MQRREQRDIERIGENNFRNMPEGWFFFGLPVETNFLTCANGTDSRIAYFSDTFHEKVFYFFFLKNAITFFTSFFISQKKRN